jgi:DNA-binding NtrC family response regulator
MKLGAYDYLVKPIDLDHLSSSLDRAREHMALKQEVKRLQALHQEQLGNEEVVVASDPMKHIFELVEILGQADRATVLITGETGTGKEIVARAIHLASPRANKPLVVVNCGAIPKDLMEAELLGYSKGAFTGATKEGKKGKVELAHQGTLFLDEVGDLPASSQTVLLRILDGQPFYPVGSNREVTANVRVVAATNRNLEEAVTDGNFREDLFYRLNVAPIYLPPLRERPEEIPPLAASFLQEYNQKYGKAFEGFSEEAIQRLKSYPWRGNVRELKNAIERVVLYEDDSVVRPEHIVFLKAGKSDDKQSAFSLPEGGLDMEEIIKGLFLQALDKAKGNKSEAARLLGVSRPTFLYRLEKYGLQDK